MTCNETPCVCTAGSVFITENIGLSGALCDMRGLFIRTAKSREFIHQLNNLHWFQTKISVMRIFSICDWKLKKWCNNKTWTSTSSTLTRTAPVWPLGPRQATSSSLSTVWTSLISSMSRPAGLKLEKKYKSIKTSLSRDVTIVERLFSSSLLALVSQTSPRKLRVCHFKKGTEICQYSYSNTILAVKLNRARLVVCLEEALYIHNIRDMKVGWVLLPAREPQLFSQVLHTIRDTPPNPRGLCALSINSDNCFLAYPGSTTTGEVKYSRNIMLNINKHPKSHTFCRFNSLTHLTCKQRWWSLLMTPGITNFSRGATILAL